MANHSQVQRTRKRNVTLQRKRRKLEGAALTESPLEKTKRSGWWWFLISWAVAVSPWLGCGCFSLAGLRLFLIGWAEAVFSLAELLLFLIS